MRRVLVDVELNFEFIEDGARKPLIGAFERSRCGGPADGLRGRRTRFVGDLGMRTSLADRWLRRRPLSVNHPPVNPEVLREFGGGWTVEDSPSVLGTIVVVEGPGFGVFVRQGVELLDQGFHLGRKLCRKLSSHRGCRTRGLVGVGPMTHLSGKCEHLDGSGGQSEELSGSGEQREETGSSGEQKEEAHGSGGQSKQLIGSGEQRQETSSSGEQQGRSRRFWRGEREELTVVKRRSESRRV